MYVLVMCALGLMKVSIQACFDLFFQMIRYTDSQQYRLIKMLPFANWTAVNCFLPSLLHSQFSAKGLPPHYNTNDSQIPTIGKKS